MRKKIITAIIILTLFASFSISVFSVNETVENQDANNTEIQNKTLQEQNREVQEKLNQSNNQLKYVQDELTVSLQKIQELDDSITEYETKCNELQSQISKLESEISVTDEQLTKVEDEYKKKQKLLQKRIVALYEAGDTTYLDVLLSSGSLMDFLSNYYMLEQIIEFDTNLINEVGEKKKTIELEKAKQEKQKSDLKTAKAKQAQMQILMKNNKMLQESYSSKLTDQEQELLTQINKYKEEQASIESQILAAINWSGSLAIQYTGGEMIWPVGVAGTYITSGYGNRLHPIQGIYKNHSGIDIGNAGYGAPVVAAADGIVTHAGTLGGYGNCVMINHGSGIVTLYGHGQEIKTTLGASVKKGDIIMLVGSTGVSTGPHLHFEVRKNGTIVDPIPYLKGENTEN